MTYRSRSRLLYFASIVLVLGSRVQGDETAPEPLRISHVAVDEVMNGKFASTDGWIGADGIYSVPMPDDSILWIFGDTLVGKIRDGKRFDLTMVNNSFARQHGWSDSSTLELLLNHDAKGQPTSFIVPENKPGYFWLWDGIVDQGKLYLFATRLTSPGTITAFDWKLMDQSLIVVDNPLGDPARWKTHQVDFPFGEFTDGYEAIWGIEILSIGNQFYIYGSVRRKKGQPRELVVATANKLTDFAGWKFYQDGRWQSEARKASALTTNVGTEGSVTYLPDRERYIYVYSPPLDPRIMMRTANTAVGPWSDPVTIYTCPEAEWDERIFCYAAKARVIPGTSDLLVSYATNSFEMQPHVSADARIYVPRFVRARLAE